MSVRCRATWCSRSSPLPPRLSRASRQTSQAFWPWFILAIDAIGRLADLAGEQLGVGAPGLGAGGVLLHDDRLDLVVCDVAGPDDHDVGEARVADPALGSVEDPAAAVAAGAGLEPDRVRSVPGFGERERADQPQGGHLREPALLLFLVAQQRDRAHREPGLHADERVDGAVAAGPFEGDHACAETAPP